jgi:hypothetical protein
MKHVGQLSSRGKFAIVFIPLVLALVMLTGIDATPAMYRFSWRTVFSWLEIFLALYFLALLTTIICFYLIGIARDLFGKR